MSHLSLVLMFLYLFICFLLLFSMPCNFFVESLTCILGNSTWGSVQFSHSVASNSLRPHEPQHASLPVHHQLPEFTQIHVHRVGDAIQLSYPLSSPSPPALNLSQHQGLLKGVSLSHQVAKVLEFQYLRYIGL